MRRFVLALLFVPCLAYAQLRGGMKPATPASTAAALAAALCPDTTYAFRADVGDTVEFGASQVKMTGIHGHVLTMPATTWAVTPATAGAVNSHGEFVAKTVAWPVVAVGRSGGILTVFCVHVYPLGTTVP